MNSATDCVNTALPPENVSVVGSVVVAPLTQYTGAGAGCAGATVAAMTATSATNPETDKSLLTFMVPSLGPQLDAPIP